MYSRKQFAALEAMSREQAAVAKTEMEPSLMEYCWQKQRNGSYSGSLSIQRTNSELLK